MGLAKVAVVILVVILVVVVVLLAPVPGHSSAFTCGGGCGSEGLWLYAQLLPLCCRFAAVARTGVVRAVGVIGVGVEGASSVGDAWWCCRCRPQTTMRHSTPKDRFLR